MTRQASSPEDGERVPGGDGPAAASLPDQSAPVPGEVAGEEAGRGAGAVSGPGTGPDDPDDGDEYVPL
jgi:hypothetical protein